MINNVNNKIPQIKSNYSQGIAFKGQQTQNCNSDGVCDFDKTLSDAMSVQGRSLVNKPFVPAKNVEEFSRQISQIDWLDDNDKSAVIYKSDCLEQKDIPVVSEFFHKAESLNPEIQKKFDPGHLMRLIYFNGSTLNLNEFSPEKLNSLKPEIIENIKTLTYLCFYPVEDVSGVNRLYETMGPEYRDAMLDTSMLFVTDKDTNEKRIKVAETVNKSDKNIVPKTDLKKLFTMQNPDVGYIGSVFSVLNSLSDENKQNISDYYIYNVLNSNYSYALEHNNDTPVCGTENFKTFETKDQMIKELASMKSSNGEWMFSNDDINKIVENGNDFGEMSKILNDLSLNNFGFSSGKIRNILMREGITYDIAKPAIEFFSKLQNDEKYNSLKNISFSDPMFIFNMEKDELANFENNLPVADVLYKYDNESFEKYSSYSLNCIKDTHIKPEILSEILNSGIFPEKTDCCQLKSFLTSTASADVAPENIQLFKDIKNKKELDFFYNGSCTEKLNNYTVAAILKRKLPEGFSLDNKTNTLKLIEEMHSDPERNAVAGNFGNVSHYLYFLIKDNEDDAQNASNIVDFIVENKMQDSNSYEFLTSHSNKETYDLIKKFEQNPLLKESYGVIPDFDVKLLEDFADVCEFASGIDAFKDIDSSEFRNILDFFKDAGSFAKESGLDFETGLNKNSVKENLTLLNEVSKSLKPELWNKVKTDVFSNVVKNTSSKPYTLKYENIAVLNELSSDSRFDKIFGNIYHEYLTEFLNADINRDVVLSKKDDMFEFINNNSDIYLKEHTFLSFEGNYQALQNEINSLKNVYPDEDIEVTAKKDKVLISVGSSNMYEYDKDINLRNKNITTDFYRDNGIDAKGVITEDADKKIKTYKISRDDAVSGADLTEKLVSVYSDENGKHVKTKVYKESEVDGFVDVKEISPSGEIKTISKTRKVGSGFVSENHFTSPSGVTTDCLFERNSIGDEKFLNVIKDEKGNVLSYIERSSTYTDADNKITKINGREYKIHYGTDTIEVDDVKNNTVHTVSLSDLNPEKNAVIYNLIKELPGDELIVMKNFVNRIELTNRLDSCINPVDRTMYVGPHAFIFEHEFGHGKDNLPESITKEMLYDVEIDSRIASDEKLQEIFSSERKALQSSAPSPVIDEVMYFVADADEHYGGEKGGLKEVIAEANGIQSGIPFHSLLKMRTEILREYFPQTLAYLNNTYLCPQ